jgi:hypothetical protein
MRYGRNSGESVRIPYSQRLSHPQSFGPIFHRTGKPGMLHPKRQYDIKTMSLPMQNTPIKPLPVIMMF